MTKGILATIHTPQDIKKLTLKELNKLASEIRKEIITVVSQIGGHLAASLGVIELTLALHYVFDTPYDKLIWDVGHQSYAHKILTERRDKFHTLRQYGGLSGFPKRSESIYDVFDVGHSGTSVSAALGMSLGRDLSSENYKVIAVIGDGSMTAGIAFEGLNQAGGLKKDIIVVLNDNEMSISRNVGALSTYLSRIMTGSLMTRFRNELKSILHTIPGVGDSFVKAARHIEESIKVLVGEGIIFEELGFKYIGPIDGHRIDHLIEQFKKIKQLEGPLLLHVITKKGKGYLPAEQKPTEFHGVGQFDVETGLIKNASPDIPTYTEVFGNTILKLAHMDERIVAITASMEHGTGLDKFSQEFPMRFFDVGIAEQHAVTFAAGLSIAGLKPFVAIYSTFLQRSYDEVITDLCLQKLPVVITIDRAGIVGEDGPTHHGLFDFSYLRHIPNITIMVPKDENELSHMLFTALHQSNPVAVRYPRGKGEGIHIEEFTQLEIGKAEVIREGKDLLIIAIGCTVYPSLQAAQLLSEVGIHATVINSRFVKPLDEKLFITHAKRVGKVITVEENVLCGGFGSAVLEAFERNNVYGIEMKRIGIPDEFVNHGPQKTLRDIYGIDANGIYHNAVKFLGKRVKK